MPNRAKLTTRGISTSTVSSDTLPKNAALTNNELDSNFLNLRDQSFSIVGDDSSGIDVRAGDTIKFTGAGGASITAVGDTITVTAGGGGGGGGANLGNLQVNNTTLSPITTNDNLILEANGTGKVIIEGQSWPSTSGSAGYVLTSDGAGNLSWSNLGGVTIVNNTITTEQSNSDFNILGNGTGSINIVGNVVNINNPSYTGVDSTVNIGDLIFRGDTITTGNTSGDITIVTQGIGGINLDSHRVRAYAISGYSLSDLILQINDGASGYPYIKLNYGTTSGGIDLYCGGRFNVGAMQTKLGRSDAAAGLATYIYTDTDRSVYLTTDHPGALTSGNVDERSYILVKKGQSYADIKLYTYGNGNIIMDADQVLLGRNDGSSISDVLLTSQTGALRLDTAQGINTGSILINDGINGDIVLAVDGSGQIQLASSTIRIGTQNSDVALTTFGTSDLTLSTNSGTNSGTIKIADGVNGDITINPNGTGVINASTSKITNVVDPVDAQDAATKNYVLGVFASISGFSIVGDDSTGSIIADQETLRVIGSQNITTAVSGDTLTITGPNLTPYAQKTDTAITIVGDDSSGTPITIGETFKIAGTQNITTAVSGDTLTITGPNLSSYITNSPITIVGDDSTGTTLNTGETLKIAGTSNISTAVSGDTLTITGPNLSSYITNSPITIVGDDSSGTTLNTGETIKIAGASNISTAVSGDTLTITGPDLSSYATTSYVTSQGYITNSPITVVGDDSTGTTLNSGETIKIAGTQNVSTAVSGDTLTITGPNLSSYATQSYVTSQGYITDIGLTFTAEDSTSVVLNKNSPFNFNGTGPITTTIVGNQVNIGLLKTDDFLVTGTTISAETTNADITITSNGTGNLNVDMDTLRIGDANADATITTNGTGDLILSTNSTLANSPTITIGDTTAGNITIKPALGATVDTVFDQGRVKSGINDWDTTVFGKSSGSVRNRYLNAGSFSHTGTRTYDLPTATTRHYNAVFGLGTTLAGATNLGNSNTSYRALHAESHLDLAGISATNAGLDSSVANYSAQTVGLSGQAFVKNSNATAATNPEATGMTSFIQIGDSSASYFDLGNITVTNAVNFTGYSSIQAAIGRTTTVTNAMGFVHTGTRSSGGGTKTITNEYAFRVLDNSQATNKYAFYADNDAYISRLGTQTNQIGRVNSLTYGTNITVDCDAGVYHTVTLTGNTDFYLTNLSTGQSISLIVKQDGTGNKTATFSTATSTAVKFPGGTPALSTAANAIDIINIFNDGTNYYGTINKAYA